MATAPTGFEVSSDGTTYGSTATFTQSGGSASGSLRIRLAATAGVSGSYNSQNIVLSSTGATSVNIATASSGNAVSTKALTITGLSAANKNWDGTTTASVTGTATYSGLENSESFSVTGTVTWAFADANVGTNKTLTRTGSYDAPSANYTVTQPTLTANITAVVPSAPTITGITPGNGQLSVAFTAPSSNGGASITNYEYSTNGGTNWTTPSPAVTASPLLITGLVNGTAYNVQLRAVNSAGSGTATASTSGTPEAPASPTITVTPATLASALSTTYGTASSTANFTVSGSTLSGNLTVTPPSGVEVSLSSGTGFADTLTLTASSGSVSATTVYARLKATAAAGNYNSASISVSGGGATAQSVATSSSGNTVAPKAVTITGLSATGKVYDGTTIVTISGTAAYSGLANGESHSVTDSVTWTFPDKNIGTGKVLSRSASYTAPNANYSLSAQPSLTADITAKELTGSFTASNKTFDNSTTATVATRAVSGKIGSEDVNHIGGTATFADVDVANGKTVTLAGATLTGADAGNYTLTSVSTTTANITQGAAAITFGALPAGKKVGDAAFSAGATTTLGTISYTSSNTAVATVNASTGSITLVAAGVTTITATVTGEANFTGSTASQTLNVGASAGYLVDLEGATETKLGYASGDVALNGISWNLTEALIGTESNDYKSGVRSIRLRGYATSVISMVADKSNGIGTISFNHQRYGTDSQIEWVVEYSTDTGSTWTSAGTFTAGASAGTFSASVNITGSGRIRIRTAATGSSNRRANIDNILITDYPTTLITASGSFAAVSTTYGTASAASATTATVTGGSLTANITATAPTGFQVSSDGSTWGSTATFTQTDGFANGTLYLRLAADAAAGSYNSQVVTLSSTGASNQTVAIANSTVSAASLASNQITLTPGAGTSYAASGPAGSTFDISYSGRTANGIATSYSSSSAPTAAGYYTVTATATGNYSGSNTANYYVAGLAAGNDSTTKPADNSRIKIPTTTLLANDGRILSDGTVVTNNLSITAVSQGTGTAASSISGAFVLFTPSSAGSDSFTYTVTDSSSGLTATGTVTVATETTAPTFTLQIVAQGTATYDGTNTSIAVDFIGVPNLNYVVEYKGELGEPSWTSAGTQSSGATGSFTVTFTKAGDHTADWNGSMFFRASR